MNREERASVRERFATARRLKRLSQKQVAQQAGVSLATVNNFERGESVPQYEKLVRILGVVDIEGDPEVTAASYPEDVQNFLLMMGAYLSLLDEGTRLDRIGQLVKEIVRHRDV
jgi:transcriptional regulator with XRE-family HTH domain